jgi:hypothetical protein
LPHHPPALDDIITESSQPVTESSYAERPLPQNHFLAAANVIKLNETFDNNTIPTGGWVITSTTNSPSWRFDDPKPRNNQTGGTGNMAIADSDVEGKKDMDTFLSTPVLDLSSAAAVKLRFKTYFRPYQTSTADVDVRIDNGTWENLWRKKGISYQGSVNLDVPQAVGKSRVQFRFRYYDANYDYYWQIDDVQVEIPTVPDAPSTLNAVESGNDVNLTWTDNSDNETSFIVEHSPNGTGSWIEAGKLVAGTTAFTHKNVGCGTTIYYRVKALNGKLASGYSNTANVTMTACPSSTFGVNEDFNAAQSKPDGWTISDPTWSFDKPNTTGGTGNAAYGHPVGAELQTPVFNMLGVDAVYLKFKTDIKIYSGQSDPEAVFVEISQDGFRI